jgi:V8-like Glu-specific endopeptidase
MLGRGIVLTAAHCLYENGEMKKSIGFFPYRNGEMRVVPGNTVANGQNSFPYAVWNVRQVWVPTPYTSQPSDISTDWGLVELEPDSSGRYAGDYTGTYAATWGVEGITTNTRIYEVGYPATGVFRTTNFFFGENQYFCDAGLTDVERAPNQTSWWMRYDCYMNGGVSGGPVFDMEGTPTIVGVANRGHDRYAGTDQAYGEVGFSIWLDSRFGEFWTATIGG